LAWAAPCAAALWLLIGAFWRGAVRRDDGLSRARRPIVLNLRSYAWRGQGRGGDWEVDRSVDAGAGCNPWSICVAVGMVAPCATCAWPWAAWACR
ncbi:hypothetical protein, partial [Rhodanobacter lindaniclasticus]